MSIDDAVKRLRGPKGTPVHITIVRQGYDAPLEFTVIRDEIPLHSVPYSFMVTQGRRLRPAARTSTRRRPAGPARPRLRARAGEGAARRCKQSGATSIILDIRDNPGGLLDQAFAVSNLFLKKGQLVVFTRGRTQARRVELHHRGGEPASSDVPLVVLTSRHSASASEIVAGAHPGPRPRPDRGRDHVRQGPGADDHAAAQRARLRAGPHHRALLHALRPLDPARLRRRPRSRTTWRRADRKTCDEGGGEAEAHRRRPQGLRRRRHHARLLRRARDARPSSCRT